MIVLVAAFNVISSLIMMVKDKTRDIAVLRTLGAGRGAVLRIFLMCGAFVGVTGTVDRHAHRRGVLPQHRGHPARGGGTSPAVGVQSLGVPC